MSTPYDSLCAHVRQTALIGSIDSLLQWDEQTYLPPAAGEYRAEQITYMAGLAHKHRTDPQIGTWLAELIDSPLAADPHSDSGTVIRQARRAYEKQCRLPQKLVEELARLRSVGQAAWVEARKKNDFAKFQPLLAKMVDLKCQEADALGHNGCRYDALLDDYEPHETTANVTKVLSALRQALVPLVEKIAGSKQRPKQEILTRTYPIARQESFGKQAAEKIGFSFERGRLDVTHHPFCTEMGPNDCRILTRYDEKFFPGAFFGTLHEAGHGIYQQGLRVDQFGLPTGSPVSLGIHESQSRMWENLVGRSRAFWQYFFPQAQAIFPEALKGEKLDDFYGAVNSVEPSLIRVEADEATYNLHIIVRFELEQALLSGDLKVADLPGAWREKYRNYLGIEPPTDADGCLQDVHWSAGLFGYFPTYSLGNLYAAQLFAQADKDLGGINPLMAKGEFLPLKTWLNEKVHQPGQCYTASEIVQRVTGKPLSHEPLMAYLRAKLEPIYGI